MPSEEKEFKYGSVSEMFEDIFGKGRVCKKRSVSRKQKKRDDDLQKAVYEYVKKIEEAFEATKGSELVFDR